MIVPPVLVSRSSIMLIVLHFPVIFLGCVIIKRIKCPEADLSIPAVSGKAVAMTGHGHEKLKLAH
jgi:uncharacterized membrane protein AbrB (regulator of aidB expression)